jgi:hypothetical protein
VQAAPLRGITAASALTRKAPAVKLRALFLLAAAAPSLLAAVIAPAAAHAGTYAISVNPGNDSTGWSFWRGAGFGKSTGPLRIFGFGQAPKLSNAWWQWDAPATTTIASGSLSVTYKTAATGTSAYMKARLRSESFPSSPQLHLATGDGSAVWTIPAGNQIVGVFLKTDIARDYADKANNTIRITALSARLTDDTAPTVALSGRLADGSWHNEAQPEPLTVTAADAGAGVASARLTAAAVPLDADVVARGAGVHPGRTVYSHNLEMTPSALADGLHTLDVTVADAGGETAVASVVLRVDAHAPVALQLSPVRTTADRRAPVSFSIDPGPSGLGQFDASLDGRPMTIAGSSATYVPASDLAYGTHTVRWHATDGAGNVRDGFWTFTVSLGDPAALRLVGSGATSILAGHRARVRFAGTSSGLPIVGARVLVSARRAGQRLFHAVRTLTTGRAGAVSFMTAPLRTTVYRARFQAAPSVTAVRRIAIHQRVRLVVGAARIRAGGGVRLTGRVYPGHARGRVLVQLLTASGWRTVAQPRLGPASRFAKTVIAGRRGSYLLRVIAPATRRNAAGTSIVVSVAAY